MEPLETSIFTWQMEKEESNIIKGNARSEKENFESESCQWLVAKHTAVSG